MTLFGMRKFLDTLEADAKKLPNEVINHVENVVLQSQEDEIFRGEGKTQGAVAVMPYGTDQTKVGRKWKPFSPHTSKLSPRRKGGKLLQDTGALRASIGVQKLPNGFAKWGTRLNYGEKQHYGARISVYGHKAELPARPFVFLTEPNVMKIVKYVGKKIDEIQK